MDLQSPNLSPNESEDNGNKQVVGKSKEMIIETNINKYQTKFNKFSDYFGEVTSSTKKKLIQSKVQIPETSNHTELAFKPSSSFSSKKRRKIRKKKKPADSPIIDFSLSKRPQKTAIGVQKKEGF
jgi:hypothetical protein